MKKGISILALILILSVSAHAQKLFKTVDATSRSWAGGMPQSGHGTSYVLEVVLLSDKAIIFDDAWVNDKYAEPKTIVLHPKKDHKPGKGDTISIAFSINVIPKNNPTENAAEPVTKPAPCAYKGQAMVAYTVNNKKHYKLISGFRQLPPVNYP